MRRALVGLAAAVALTGCGDDGSPAPEATTTAGTTTAGTTTATTTAGATTSAPASDREAADAVFSDFVTDQGLTSHGSVEDLIALALAVCDAYDRGVAVADVVASLEDTGFSPYEAGQVNGAATATYCPQHEGAASGS